MDPAEPNPLPASQYDPEPIQSAASIKPESKLFRALKNVSPFTYCFAAVLTISLITLAYFVLQNLSLKSQLGMNSFKWPWTNATCTYQGIEFKPGESVPSVDGCNSCSCSETGEVACTLIACEADSKILPVETSEEITNPESSNLIKNFPIESPSIYGFTKLADLKSIGVSAQFPPAATISQQTPTHYNIKTSNSDAANFMVVDYDGGGRRAWFTKEYPWASQYTFEPFTSNGHSGYIAYAKSQSQDLSGSLFYFTALNSKQMLTVNGTNYFGANTGTFFKNLQSFRSFLSTIKLTSPVSTGYEEFPTSEIYRWSDQRQTNWSNEDFGLKITSPLWVESRYQRERDENGKITYTDWNRETPTETIDSIPYASGTSQRVSMNGSYASSLMLVVLPTEFQNKSFSEVAESLLVAANFCSSEWKNSKSDCTSSNYCYTRDEVVENLTVKEDTFIGSHRAQLRGMNQDFSNTNDCRAGEEWLIRGENGMYIITNISPRSDSIKIEAI